MTHYDIRVYGKVQGVFYRANTMRMAHDLGISGWVKNQEDGSVLMAVEGDKNALDELVSWCKKGPAYAQVTQVVYSEAPMQHFQNFRIIR